MPNLSEKLNLNNPRQLTALVAGGAGFLGSHLCETLLTQNIRVLAVDNLESGTKDNIKHLLANPSFHYLEVDLNQAPLTLAADTNLDYIFHLAGVEEHTGEDLSLETLLVNSLGTKTLLDLAREKKAKFLLVSTADIYSGALSNSSLKYYFGRNLSEASLLTHHEAKRYAETLTYEYFKKYNLDARICRVLDTYGPRINLNSGNPLATLLKQALLNQPLTIVGDGLKTWHPTYVSDVVFGLVKAILTENTAGRIFNLINPEKITTLVFVEEINKAFGKKFDLEFKKEPTAAPFLYHNFQLENATNILNWKPRVRLIDGLITTGESFKKTAAPLPIASPGVPEKHHASFPKISFSFISGLKTKKAKVGLKRAHLRLTIFSASLLLLLLGLVYPAVSFFVNFSLGNQALTGALKSFAAVNIAQTENRSLSAEADYQRAQNDIEKINWLLTLMQQRAWAAKYEQTITALGNLASALSLSSQGLEPLLSLRDENLVGQPLFKKTFLQKINQAQINLSLAADRLAIAEVALKTSASINQIDPLYEKIQLLNQELPRHKQLVRSLKVSYDLLPAVLGFNETRNYLVLTSDNQIIKAPLGKIKSYEVVTMNNGQIQAGSQDSFAEIEKQLDLADIDLPTFAGKLKTTFGQKGVVLNGVFFLDNTFYSSATLFKSGALAASLNNIRTGSITTILGSLPKLATLLDQKQAAVVLFDPAEAAFFNSQVWDGEVVNEKNQALTSLEGKQAVDTGNLLADYLSVTFDSGDDRPVFSLPQIIYEPEISSVGLLEGKVTLQFKSQDKGSFNGIVRVLVPLGSSLVGIDSSVKVKPQVDQKYSKTQISFPLVHPEGEEMRVAVLYQIPLQTRKQNQPITYSLYIQKQLGVISSDYRVSLKIPPNYQLEDRDPFFVKSAGGVSTALNRDSLLFYQLNPNQPEEND